MDFGIPERWLSGRKRHPAKVLSPSRGSVGSNPTLSAQAGHHFEKFREWCPAFFM